MVVIWVLLLVAPFFLPLHFYPIPTYPEELLAALLVVALAAVVVIRNRDKLVVNQLLFWWLGLGCVWLISWYANQKQVVSGALFYQYFWVLGLLAIISGAGLKDAIGRMGIVRSAARVLVFSGFLYASLGLAGYYGLFKFIIPWIDSDQKRLVGVMAQPNLSALYLAFALSAFGFLLTTQTTRLGKTTSLLFLLVVCLAGVLTGSRGFYLILIAQLVLSVGWFMLSRRQKAPDHAAAGSTMRYQALILLVCGSLLFAFPPIDDLISGKLTDMGFLQRTSSSEMLVERFQGKGQPRLGEWRKIVEGYPVIDNPWVGVGPGAYSEFSVAADKVIDEPFRNGRTWRNAHNIFLMAFVEWGITGLVFLGLFCLALIYQFWVSERNSQNLFVWLILISLLAHNLVEFSLWHLQFLIVFLVFLSTQFRTISLRISTPFLRWTSVTPVLVLTLWIAIGSSKDFAKLVYLFSKPDVGPDDVKALDLIAQNSLWRPYSRMVMYYRLNPYPTGIEGQLQEASLIGEWSPLNLVLMRQASLTAALGEAGLACRRIARATELYPLIIGTLDEELVYLKSHGLPIELDRMRECIVSPPTQSN